MIIYYRDKMIWKKMKMRFHKSRGFGVLGSNTDFANGQIREFPYVGRAVNLCISVIHVSTIAVHVNPPKKAFSGESNRLRAQ